MRINTKEKRGRQDKKGVSEVLATILIVLFVIAALVIVSVVLFQFIRSKSQEITAGCVSIDIAITKAEYNQTGNITMVYAKRAGGDAEMAGMKFVFDGREKTPSSESDNTALKILETGRYIFNNITSKPRKIEAAPIVKTEAEKEMNCGIKAAIAERNIVEKSISVSDNIEPSSGEPQPPSQPSTGGLVGYWKFDESGGTTASDSSGNNNHGILLNGPAWTTGKKGNALSFDGSNDYVDAGNGGAIGNYISIEAWVKPYGLSSEKTIISRADDDQAATDYSLGIRPGGKVLFHYRGLNDAWQLFQTGDNVIVPNVWQHIAVTHTYGAGSATKIYVNGNLISASWVLGDGGSLNNVQASRLLQIGAIQFPPTSRIGYWDGLIDEVRVWNRTLTTEEINQRLNIALGKSYAKNPSPSGTYPDSGDSEVTDGTECNFQATLGCGFGYASTDSEVIVALDSIRKVGRVRGHFADAQGGAGIYLPSKVAVSTSADNINFNSQGNLAFGYLLNTGRWGELILPSSVDARYIKFTATRGGEWTFWSELEVYPTS